MKKNLSFPITPFLFLAFFSCKNSGPNGPSPVRNWVNCDGGSQIQVTKQGSAVVVHLVYKNQDFVLENKGGGLYSGGVATLRYQNYPYVDKGAKPVSRWCLTGPWEEPIWLCVESEVG